MISRSTQFGIGAWVLIFGGAAYAADAPLSYSFEPTLFKSELISESGEQLQEARFNSGLGVAVKHELVQLAVDYKLESLLREDTTPGQDSLSQVMGASVSSSLLNQWLGVDADINADSRVASGGDVYRYRVMPGVSTSVSELADLSLRYQYQLDKSAAAAVANEKRGVVMGLKGSLYDGRLSWNGVLESFSEFADSLTLTRSTELFKFRTRYQLARDLSVELSSAVKEETRSASADETPLMERRYGAGFAWSPSDEYSLTVKVNHSNDTAQGAAEVSGSGTINWFPQRHLSFSLGYGDTVADGARGVMLSTRIDLDSGWGLLN